MVDDKREIVVVIVIFIEFLKLTEFDGGGHVCGDERSAREAASE